MLKFYSTNNRSRLVSLQEAIFNSLPSDGGLYMPCQINRLEPEVLTSMSKLSIQEIALEISSVLLKDYLSKVQIEDVVSSTINFPVPIINLENGIDALELFHGPTCAFKDFGGRFMARVVEKLINKQDKDLNILVATSGDTGSAVASGFYGISGINVFVLYPSKKISFIQEKQISTLGNNIKAIEIEGSFDDCQKLVKQAFLDNQIKEKMNTTSANSINVSRLIPQSFYYAFASSRYKNDIPTIFSVPSGNYGNLTAGIIAKKMGSRIDSFIASSNANDIFPKYLNTGKFIPKASIQTISNAMDVGNPSNFPRILELFSSNLEEIKSSIKGFSINDEETKKIIKNVYEKYNYILDPHGAVAYSGIKKYQQLFSTKANYIFLETASPAKFSEIIEPIILKKFELPEQLKSCLSKEKLSIKMSADFLQFKNYLLG